jgi:hypothetical protein
MLDGGKTNRRDICQGINTKGPRKKETNELSNSVGIYVFQVD